MANGEWYGPGEYTPPKTPPTGQNWLDAINTGLMTGVAPAWNLYETLRSGIPGTGFTGLHWPTSTGQEPMAPTGEVPPTKTDEDEASYTTYLAGGGTLPTIAAWIEAGRPKNDSLLGARIPLPEGMPQQYTDSSGRVMYWDGSGEYIQTGFEPSGVYTPEADEPTTYPPPGGGAPTDPYGRTAIWVARLGQWDYPPDWGKDPTTQQAGYTPPGTAPQWKPGELDLQQQYLALEQQQAAQEQQNYLAQMAAQPKSWLEYAAASGQPPVVQPWMKPLMPQEYPELAGLQAGQPVPGWPEQFGAGGGAPLGGGYQPWTAPPTGGATPTTGGGITGGGAQPSANLPFLLGGGTLDADQLTARYQAAGLSPEEAQREALHELAYEKWKAIPPGEEGKRQAYLEMGLSAAVQPKTQERYQQAIGNLQSGQPLLGGLGTSGKFDLVEQLIRQGVDRTLAERQVFGGSRAFAPYTPISDISGAAPTTTPYAPSTMPVEERAPTPKQKPTPSYTPSQMPMEESMGNVRAYIPGMSWHEVDPQGIGPEVEESNWLGRMRQLRTSRTEGEQGATQAPATPTQSLSSPGQEYNPAQYAAGSWAGYNPNLPLGQMPALTRPSRQYQARMGPTASDQYYAYVQARTGMTPEEMQFRLWSMSPPGGRFGGLSHVR